MSCCAWPFGPVLECRQAARLVAPAEPWRAEPPDRCGRGLDRCARAAADPVAVLHRPAAWRRVPDCPVFECPALVACHGPAAVSILLAAGHRGRSAGFHAAPSPLAHVCRGLGAPHVAFLGFASADFAYPDFAYPD